MKFKRKVLDFKQQQQLLISFLEDPGKEGLTMKQKIKLCGEITRLQFNVERLERMTLKDSNKECYERPIEVKSTFVKPKYNFKKIPKIESTWHNRLR